MCRNVTQIFVNAQNKFKRYSGNVFGGASPMWKENWPKLNMTYLK